MRRTLLFVVGGVLLGAAIHIVIVLMVPYFASHDAWAEMRQFGPDGRFNMLPAPSPGVEPLPSLDPRMVQAVCRFDLTRGPIRMEATLPDDFWSVALFDRRGRSVYSLNDRSAERSELDVAVLTPVQMAQLRQDPPESLETAIVVELPIDRGFALVRVFVPDESSLPGAVAALEAADCGGEL